jgi:quercetin dioxygenase-like cupin family protein
MTTQLRNVRSTFTPSAFLTATDLVPWVPLSAGKSFKPLRFLDGNRGFVELLRLEPGELIPRHRHTGEVHAYNVQGWRELDSGERVGPGAYVYEPVGNVDAWRVIGDEPLVVLVVVHGAVEYLDGAGKVTQRWDALRLRDAYERHCAASGVPARDLSRVA